MIEIKIAEHKVPLRGYSLAYNCMPDYTLGMFWWGDMFCLLHQAVITHHT